MGDTNYTGKPIVLSIVASFVTAYLLDYDMRGLLVFPLSLVVTLITNIIPPRGFVGIGLIAFFLVCVFQIPSIDLGVWGTIILASVIVGMINKYIS